MSTRKEILLGTIQKALDSIETDLTLKSHNIALDIMNAKEKLAELMGYVAEHRTEFDTDTMQEIAQKLKALQQTMDEVTLPKIESDLSGQIPKRGQYPKATKKQDAEPYKYPKPYGEATEEETRRYREYEEEKAKEKYPYAETYPEKYPYPEEFSKDYKEFMTTCLKEGNSMTDCAKMWRQEKQKSKPEKYPYPEIEEKTVRNGHVVQPRKDRRDSDEYPYKETEGQGDRTFGKRIYDPTADKFNLLKNCFKKAFIEGKLDIPMQLLMESDVKLLKSAEDEARVEYQLEIGSWNLPRFGKEIKKSVETDVGSMSWDEIHKLARKVEKGEPL